MRLGGQFVVNPTHDQRDQSDLDLVYVGNKTDVIMIEGAAEEMPEADFINALALAQEQVKILVTRRRKNSPPRPRSRSASSLSCSSKI